MKPLYIVVHSQMKPYPECLQPKKHDELLRVLKEEEYIILKEDTCKIPENLSKKRLIRVCGKYAEMCAWEVWNNLKGKGYDVNIYEPAFLTISLSPVL